MAKIEINCDKCGWKSELAPTRQVTIAALEHMLSSHPEEPETDYRRIQAHEILVELEN